MDARCPQIVLELQPKGHKTSQEPNAKTKVVIGIYWLAWASIGV
jgi:hypothetical protein